MAYRVFLRDPTCGRTIYWCFAPQFQPSEHEIRKNMENGFVYMADQKELTLEEAVELSKKNADAFKRLKQ